MTAEKAQSPIDTPPDANEPLSMEKLRWLPAARNDLESIHRYIAEDSALEAERTVRHTSRKPRVQ